MDDKEIWKNKMTKNTACKLKSNPMVTKYTTVILSNYLCRKVVLQKVEKNIK